MPHLRRERPGHFASVPDDVTDPLLWRLAIDVLAAHQPGQNSNCRNLQCVGEVAPAPRQGTPAEPWNSLAQLRAPPLEPRSFDGDAGREVGWFTPSMSVASTRWRLALASRRWSPALRSVA